jgi:hypothetical protein
VARYYFDVQNGKPLVRDDEGTEFDSFEAAVQAAARSAAEIGTSRLAKGDTSDVVLVVRDEQKLLPNVACGRDYRMRWGAGRFIRTLDQRSDPDDRCPPVSVMRGRLQLATHSATIRTLDR